VSAGGSNPALKVSADLALVAPRFADAVTRALAECKALSYDTRVYEAYRSQELQALYYERGRTVKPPEKPVTNAPTNRYSWHGYGLAVDVVHATKYWKPDEGDAWFAKVAAVFAKHGCRWGGEWTKPDLPHIQWGLCKPSPSDSARALLDSGGIRAVWSAVGAV
jgi:peptidoglycan L-alanyl-D-glutamate endopeptidase CwlK